MHYLVHANDVPGRERELLEITRKYETAAPRNPHALHMPTHIYTRLGDWDGVIRGNLLAADAALEHPAGEHGEFVWDEFPHAIEYLVYAYLQQGDEDKARAQLERLAATARLEPTFKTAFHLASTRRALRARAPGVGRGRLGAVRAARQSRLGPVPLARSDRRLRARPRRGSPWPAGGCAAASQRLEALEANAARAGEELFARNIHVLRLEVDAWIGAARRQAGSGHRAHAGGGDTRDFHAQARRDAGALRFPPTNCSGTCG